MTEEQVRHGGCLCGQVRYETRGEIRNAVACHCRQCRVFNGDRTSYSNANLERFTLLEDRGLKWYRSSEEAERGFCSNCGSSLFYRRIDGDRVSIAAGTFEGATGLKTVAHIFCASKGDYYELPEDGLPRYDGAD